MEKLFEGCSYQIVTFGCQMNVRDSEHVAGIMENMGFVRAKNREEADCVLFNTCCVREHAEKRVFGNIGALREWKMRKPSRIIVVFGCMMQQSSVAEKLYRRFPFVDVVFGTAQLGKLQKFLSEAACGNRVLASEDSPTRIEEHLPSVRDNNTNAFVNINFGCNNYCSYCIVPYVRGPERSRQPEAIEEEVCALIDAGYSEITLLGQNVNAYGQDLLNTSFPELLHQISSQHGLRRLRFMTSHPKDLSQQLIETMATHPNICHHVHLPLQSGSDHVLADMNRCYTREQYLDIISRLRKEMDDVEITTDIIVGFPGESENDFLDTLDMITRIGFSNAFTFKFSPRMGTKAAQMTEQVPDIEKKNRLLMLNTVLQNSIEHQNLAYIGYAGEVLVEGAVKRKQQLAFGKFQNFKMVYFPGDDSMIGQYVNVRVNGVEKNSLYGRIVEDDYVN